MQHNPTCLFLRFTLRSNSLLAFCCGHLIKCIQCHGGISPAGTAAEQDSGIECRRQFFTSAAGLYRQFYMGEHAGLAFTRYSHRDTDELQRFEIQYTAFFAACSTHLTECADNIRAKLCKSAPLFLFTCQFFHCSLHNVLLFNQSCALLLKNTSLEQAKAV